MDVDHTHLPLEIHHLIIDTLANDKHALLAASLVCTAWRMASYRHLFFDLALHPNSVQSFARLLQNSLSQSAILPQVRQLSLNLHSSGTSWNALRSQALHTILTHLSNTARLECLTLSNLHFPHMDTEISTLLSLGFTSIRSLQLSNASFETLTQFTDFISAYTQIERMVWRNIVCLSPNSPPPPSPSKLPSGRYGVQLFSPPNSGLSTSLCWSQSSETTPISSEELWQLAHIFMSYRSNINRLLRFIGPSLHCLDLMGPFQFPGPDCTLYGLDLSHTTSLEYLSLGCSTRVLSVMPWVLRVLYHLEVTTLKTLEITFAASRQFFLDLPFLEYLDRVLQAPQCQTLEVIHFFAHNALSDKEIEDVIIKHVSESLASWHQEGKLRFTFPSS